jgi:hypothetical protein
MVLLMEYIVVVVYTTVWAKIPLQMDFHPDYMRKGASLQTYYLQTHRDKLRMQHDKFP